MGEVKHNVISIYVFIYTSISQYNKSAQNIIRIPPFYIFYLQMIFSFQSVHSYF